MTLTLEKKRSHIDLELTSINTSHYWYVDNPFILANQLSTTSFFYLKDPKYGINWIVVQIVQNKCLWDVSEVGDIENDQLDVAEVGGIGVDESIDDTTFCRNDIEPTLLGQQLQSQDNNVGFINDESEDTRSSPDISSRSDELLD